VIVAHSVHTKEKGPTTRTATLASIGLAGVLIFLAAFSVWGARTSSSAAAGVQKAIAIRDAFESVRDAVASEESLERKYRLEPSPAVRNLFNDAASSFVRATETVDRIGSARDRVADVRLRRRHRFYLASIVALFAATDRHDTRAALKIDNTQTDPAFSLLQADALASSDRHRAVATADLMELASSQQTLLYMTVGAFTLGLVLLALFEGVRRKSARKLLETVSELRSAQLAERLERLEAERERAENEQLRNLDRMKDEFVALVSHELRTPLTSIRGYLELVLDDAEQLPSQSREFLKIVDRNADRLLYLVGDLLLIAQAESGMLAFEWTAVELAPLAALCVQAAQPAAEDAGVELVFSSESSDPIVGDPARILQLLDNLISNAIKFTPVGGRVDVLVDASADSAVIEVRDTGFGIAAEDQEQLFERFFRTRSANDMAIAGTGLGLSIAKAIVDAHGGSISIDSAEGRGTTFRVELPVEKLEPVLARALVS
jgi:signal transduction histidine kinase